MNQLRYYHEEIVWQEVPNEVSLTYLFTGCPLACKGCHSARAWKVGSGVILERAYFCQRLATYKNLISCVLFMGGEWCAESLLEFLIITRENNLNTCLYTGLEFDAVPEILLPHLTYLKTGRWIYELGGLDNPLTNQRFIDLRSGANLNYLFWRNHDSPY